MGMLNRLLLRDESGVVLVMNCKALVVYYIDKQMVVSMFKLGNLVFSMSCEANSFNCSFMLSLGCLVRYPR